MNTPSVRLELSATPTPGATLTEAAFSNDGTTYSDYEPYAAVRTGWALSAGDGVKKVHAKVRDSRGGEGLFTAEVQLDATRPLITGVTLAGGLAFTRSQEVELLLTVAQDSGSALAEVCWSVGVAQSCAPFVTSWSVALPPGDGEVSVAVTVRDAAGNSSAPLSDSILLDTAAPTSPSVELAGGAAATNSTAVAYVAAAADATTGVSAHCVRSSPDLPAPSDACWQSTTPMLGTVEVPPGDGMKTVHAWFRDAAGNVSASASSLIRLDQTPPELTRFVLAGGAAFTGSLDVELGFDASDLGSGVVDLCQGSEDPPTTCVPSALAARTTLPGGDGAKTVYAFVRDLAGNASPIRSDQVTLDQTAPVVDAVSINGGAAHTRSLTVTVTAATTEAGAGVALIAFSVDGGAFSQAISYSPGGHPVTLPAGEGTRTIAVRLTDAAGNASETGSGSIVVDVTPPEGMLTLAGSGGAVATNVSAITYTVSATDARSGYTQYCLTETSAAPALESTCWKSAAAATGTFTLTATEGSRPVHAWFRDAADNVSAPVVKSILYDVTPPELHGLVFAGGLAYSPARVVPVEIDATETGSGVATLCLDAVDPRQGCSPYTGANTFDTGIDGAGTSNVQAYVVDVAGNRSAQLGTLVSVDENAPVLQAATINAGAAFATSRDVSVTLDASDDFAGLWRMDWSIDGAAFGPPSDFTTPVAMQLPAGEGLHSVAVRVYDRAGNVSVTREDTITLDTVRPTGTVELNGGAVYGGSSVTATLQATDASGVQDVCLTETALSSAPPQDDPCWQAYEPTKTVYLSVWEGTATVHAWFRDAAGLASATSAADDIQVDSQGPTYPEGLTAFPLDRAVRFTWSPSSDDVSGVSHYELRLEGTGDWLHVTGTEVTLRPLVNEQEYTLQIRAVDHAGNPSFTLTSLPFRPRFPFAFAYRKPFGATLNALVVGPEGTVHAFGERGAAFESQDLFASSSPVARRFDTSADADWYGAAGGTAGVRVTVGSGGTIAAGVGVRGWRSVKAEGSAQTLHAVVFVDDDTFVAVGDEGRIVRGTVLATATEITALSVTAVPGPTTASLRALARSSATRDVVAVGDDGTVLRSLDDGATWEKLEPPAEWRASNLTAIAYHPGLAAFVIGTTSPGVPPVFSLTDDGAMGTVPGADLLDAAVVALHHGANEGLWMLANLAGAGRVFLHDGTKFIDQAVAGDFMRAIGSHPFTAPGTPPVPTDGVALVGESGQVAVRTAAGFAARTFGLPSAINGFHTLTNLGWAVGADGAIAHTTNFGDSWELQASGTTADLLGISAGPSVAYVVGEGGIVLQRAWNAASWSPMTSPTSATLHAVDCERSWCLAVGAEGAIAAIYTTAGWGSVAQDAGAAVLRAVDTYTDASESARTIVVGDGGTVRLQQPDGSWSSPFTIAGGANLTGVAAAPGGTVMAVTASGRIWRSADHGATWTELPFSGAGTLSSVRHASANRWYVAGAFGALFRTDDAGETWRRLATRSSASLSSLFVSPSSADEVWATGSGSTVLRTVSGGD